MSLGVIQNLVGKKNKITLNHSEAFSFQRNIKDKLQNIPISVTVSLSSSQTTSASADQLSFTPVLNRYQQKTTSSEVEMSLYAVLVKFIQILLGV